MKKLKLMCLTIALLGLIASGSVWAHGRYNAHRLNFGLNLGYDPFYYGSFGYRDPFFYPPYCAYPPTVMLPSAPSVYIEQQETATPTQPQIQYWYFCQNPEGYYPYVKECPDGWLQVVPHPSAQ